MILRAVLLLLLVTVLPWRSEALACSGSFVTRLVGYHFEAKQALLRTAYKDDAEVEQVIDLLEVDLASGAITKKWPILAHGEDQATRGRRWREAEADLVGRDFVILGEGPLSDLAELARLLGASVEKVEREGENGTAVDLVATRGERRVVLFEGLWFTARSANHWQTTDGPYFVPLASHFFFFYGGCRDGFVLGSIEEMKGKLDEAPTATPTPSP